MQAPKPFKKKTGSVGAKIIIALISLGGTLGLWNLFAYKAEMGGTPPKNLDKVAPPLDANNAAVEFPPIPTLAAIRTQSETQAQAQNTAGLPSVDLKVVNQPTPAPAANNKPVFQYLTINRPGNSGPSSSGSSR